MRVSRLRSSHALAAHSHANFAVHADTGKFVTCSVVFEFEVRMLQWVGISNPPPWGIRHENAAGIFAAGADGGRRRGHVRPCANLSRASRHVRRALCARRRYRISGAAVGAKARAAAGEAVRDREPARRRRSDRGALRRPRGARWLHHSHGALSGDGDQRRLAQEASL